MAQSGYSKASGDTYVTSVRSDEYSYTWVINNFRVWLGNVEGVQVSSKFPSGDQEQVKWCLDFYPKSTKDEEHCSIFLKLVSSPQGKLNCSFELTLSNGNGNLIEQRCAKVDFELNTVKGNWGWPDFVKRQTLLKKIKPDDKLLIKCKINTNLTIVNETLVKHLASLPSSLTKDLKSLVDGEKFGDVTILVAGQRFLAHKCILSARSSVFNAMFEHQMQEGIENCVSVDDVEPEVFKELLRYIYTDELIGVETMAHGLYKAADKYDIPTLKSLCRGHILGKLSWETGAETLILADLHGDLEMKKHVLHFLSGSEVAVKITETDAWKELVRAYPHLVGEVLKAIAIKAK